MLFTNMGEALLRNEKTPHCKKMTKKKVFKLTTTITFCLFFSVEMEDHTNTIPRALEGRETLKLDPADFNKVPTSEDESEDNSGGEGEPAASWDPNSKNVKDLLGVEDDPPATTAPDGGSLATEAPAAEPDDMDVEAGPSYGYNLQQSKPTQPLVGEADFEAALGNRSTLGGPKAMGSGYSMPTRYSAIRDTRVKKYAVNDLYGTMSNTMLSESFRNNGDDRHNQVKEINQSAGT